MTLDTTLQSNIVTAYAPRPFAEIGHRAKHLADSLFLGLGRGLERLIYGRPTQPVAGLRPPGDVPRRANALDDPNAPGRLRGPRPRLVAASAITAPSRETWREIPQLPAALADDVQRYQQCAFLASGPTRDNSRNFTLDKLREQAPNVQDAFGATVQDARGSNRNLLPDTVRQSTLVNAAVRDHQKDLGIRNERILIPNPRAGRCNPNLVTHLSDPLTGFSAGITFDPDRKEMVVAFSGLGSSKMGGRQFFRCASNWLGLVPKNMSQASKLTKLVKQHVEQLNADLPDDRKIKLTLTGHSMGGGLASYAALRNKVPAVVTNPMRLGWGARARVGQSRLQEADKYLTEVVAQGDWVSDSNAAKLYTPLAPVFNIRGPLGSARRYMVPTFGVKDSHNNFSGMLKSLKEQDQRLHALAPYALQYLDRASLRARGNMRAGNLSRAVMETVTTDMKGRALTITGRQKNTIARCVDRLVSGTQPQTLISNSEANKLRDELRVCLAEVRQANAIDPSASVRNLPESLLAIERDFVTHPPSSADFGYGIDENGRALREQLTQDYLPGTDKCNELLRLAGISDTELDPANFEREVKIQFIQRFGPNGHGVKFPLSRNADDAEQALLWAISGTLRNQSHGRCPLKMPDEQRREQKISMLDDWAKHGIPEAINVSGDQAASDLGRGNVIEEEEDADKT